ncbi:helix-turn-helix domain-containing protein [Streptomyces sp. adm13(2018)]|uniref:AraC family transcriptional regulator n=1 Tax=Streptomyces sp. adm13(2018) TaxID=2479007 RepID=UPI0011CE361C|nr:GyrI-like domain-containing protein [Streptomyces sp. adm13(2018)]TXS10894.1 helix-turn-helix domain-containing protein [Streptomyces sp. adm13(2018)]
MLERLNRALDHIEEHLVAERDGALDAAALARIAATSEYHFRRMFSALAGMPLCEYVRRRRLTVAGAEVLAGERTLLEIAVRHGYGSGEAFARAFRAVHGVGPGEARRTGAALSAQPRMSFRLVVEGSSSMRYRVVEKKDLRVVGRKARVPLVHEGENPAIAAHIRSLGQETIERLGRLSDQEPRGVVSAVVHLGESREEGVELDYWHAVVSDAEVPAEFEVLDVPAGSWAVFENEGPLPQAVQHLWRDIFTQWFPSNPYAIRPGPEIMSISPSEDWSTARAALWIPVEHTAG